MYQVQTLSTDVARLVTEGTAYCDIQDNDKVWFRIHLEVGDFIVIPPDTSFRFTTDTRVIADADIIAILLVILSYCTTLYCIKFCVYFSGFRQVSPVLRQKASENQQYGR